MQQTTNTCISVFKDGDINREEYTAVWVTLINRLVRDQHVLARKEP